MRTHAMREQYIMSYEYQYYNDTTLFYEVYITDHFFESSNAVHDN